MYPVCYNAMVLHEPYSGVEVTVHQLACALVTCGTLPLSLCIPPNQRTIPVAPHVTVHVSKLATQSRLLRILWEQTLLPLHLKRIRSPLLHAPAYVAPLLCPCPFILTIHDLHVLTHPQFCSRSNRLHYRLLIPPSIRKAAAIIAYSPYTRQTILNYFPEAEGRLVVIPPGIAPTFSRCTDYARLRSVRQRYALPLSFLLFVGDLSQRKNIVNLIRAFAIVQAERPDMHLILAGAADPKAGADLDRVIREHGVPHRVSRIGYVHADDLPVFYSLAEAFVFPSHDEGFGLPPLEAMACGCPVVCSGGAAVENCGDSAVSCDPQDRASIASAVSLLLDHPQFRAEKIAAGYRKAAKFTWENATHETEALYRKILKLPAAKS